MGGLLARSEGLSSDVAALKREVAELRAEIRTVEKRQGQDFRLLANVILAIVWVTLFALTAKGFGWLS